MTRRILAPLVWWIRIVQTQRASVSSLEKILRAILMLPAFSLLFLLLRLRLRFRGPLRVEATTRWGGRFQCHPPDLIQMYVWLFGVWEPDLTHFIRQRLKPYDVFVDVGANIGYYTALAAKAAGVSAVAIEASPIVFAALKETISRNEIGEQVRAINKAAASQAGHIQVYAGPQHNIGLTTTVAQRGMPAQATIEAQTLDAIFHSDEIHRARLIKIDVEGGEPEVLAGMKAILAGGRDDLEILIELSPNWWSDSSKRPIDVLQPFLDAGFHLYEMENNYWPWRYLWPNDLSSIKRCTRDLTKRVKRIDLVLSRVDGDSL